MSVVEAATHRVPLNQPVAHLDCWSQVQRPGGVTWKAREVLNGIDDDDDNAVRRCVSKVADQRPSGDISLLQWRDRIVVGNEPA